jgi:membrane-bound ClpP family serine protease
LEIVRARRTKGAVQDHRFLTPDELEEKDDAGQKVWTPADTVKHAGKPLIITGENAPSLGFARKIVPTADDLKELYRFYLIEPGQVREATADWLDKLANFLADPLVSAFLVLIGISCLILELKMPGASLPGVVAAICFVLFFWSQSQMNGQITLLAVLLFLLGIVLLGMEIFVIPGFGVIGISGIGLILFGLALATVERMPQTSGEWSLLGRAVLMFGLSLSGAVVLAFIAGRFLPYIPVANRLLLPPPDEQEADDPLRAAQLAENLQLLGAIGTAATMLRPSGMAQFGDRFVDVVTDGSFIPAGARVRVIEIEGYRVVVKEVSA